jgi:hypothetical protein
LLRFSIVVAMISLTFGNDMRVTLYRMNEFTVYCVEGKL